MAKKAQKTVAPGATPNGVSPTTTVAPGSPAEPTFKERLTESVIKPASEWVLRRSWGTRAAILVAILAFPLVARDPARIAGTVSIAGDVVGAIQQPATIALGAADAGTLNDSINTLSDYLRAELQRADDNDPNHNAWGVAQMMVAIAGRDGSSPASLATTLATKRSPDCMCWKEYANKGNPHAATANWVAVAFSRGQTASSSQDLEYLLNSQHNGGWWSPTPATDEQQNASTYATAWSVLAIHEQMSAGLVPLEKRAQADAALHRGRAWLVSSKASPARWKDYPSAPIELGKESVALSGLVLHVLGKLNEDTKLLHKQWLDHQPDETGSAADADSNPFPVIIGVGMTEKDGVRHLRLPWTIIATIDSYPDGDLLQRARALSYIRRVVQSLPESRRPVMSAMPWAASELLIALRYLRHDTYGGRPVI